MLMRWIAAAAVIAGCYRSTPPASPDPAPRPAYESSSARPRPMRPPERERSEISDAIAKIGEFADEMCACTDQTCANRVQDELTKWAAEVTENRDENLKPTEEEMAEVTKVSQRLGACMMTAMGAGSPPPPTP